MPEPLSDLALVSLVAERVMGWPEVLLVWRCDEPAHCNTRTLFDPLHYDSDFGALLDKCHARWGVSICTVYGEPPMWVAGVGEVEIRDPSRRRALVLAAAAVVRAEGEGT